MLTQARADTFYDYLAGYDAQERDFLCQGFSFSSSVPF